LHTETNDEKVSKRLIFVKRLYKGSTLEEGEPWKKQEIQHVINTEFDDEYHPNCLPRLVDDLGLSYAIPRTERPDRPDNAAEILNERVSDGFAEDEPTDPHNKHDGDDSDDK